MFNQNFQITSDIIEHDGYYTRKIKVFPTDQQKQILFKWMDAYLMMYNYVTNYFKNCMFEKIKPVKSIKKLKANFYEEKNEIRKNTTITINNKQISINSHILDYAINDALKRYESCLTNKRNGNIKSYRLRYLKQNKKNKLIKLEKANVTNSSICASVLGKLLNCEIKDFNYLQNFFTVMTLHYSTKENVFTLLVKYNVNDKSNINEYNRKTDLISIDPGIRTVMTGYSNNHIIKIGTNVQKSVRNRIRTIDKIRNKQPVETKQYKKNIIIEKKIITEKRKTKIIAKKQKKLKNRIMDMQWKITKYLTTHYKTILIGNFSTKSMGESKKIKKILKRIGNAYNFYKLKEKIKYRSNYTNTKYKEVDESYTSKCCSNCNKCKYDLGANKIYNCDRCGIIIDRDVNGAKNILIAGQN